MARQALRIRRLVYALLFTQAAIFAAFFPLAPVFERKFDLSTIEIGAIYASLGVTIAVVGIPVGVVTDRLGAARLTVAAAVLLTVTSAGHALALGFWSLFVSRTLLGVCAAVLLTAGMAWLAELVPNERRAAALAVAMPITGLGSLAGPAFAGLLAESAGPRLPFAVGAAVAALLAAALLPAVRSGSHVSARRIGDGVRLEVLRTQPLLAGAVAVVLVAALAESTVNLLAPLQLDDNGVGPGRVGLALSAAAALFIATGLAAARFSARVVSLKAAGAGLAALAVVLVPLAVSEATEAIVAGVMLRSAVLGLLWTIAFPLAALAADRSGAGRGTVNGLLILAIGAGNTIGPLVGSALADAVGYRTAYAALLGVAAVMAVFVLGTATRERPTGLETR